MHWPAGLSAGQPSEQFGQGARLLGGEVLKEQPLDAAHMRAAGGAQLLVAGVSQLGIGDAGVVGAAHAPYEPRRDESVHEPGDARAREHGALRQLGHGQPALLRLGEVEHHLIVTRGDAVLAVQLGVEHAHDGGVALQEAAPGLKRGTVQTAFGEGLHGSIVFDRSISGPGVSPGAAARPGPTLRPCGALSALPSP